MPELGKPSLTLHYGLRTRDELRWWCLVCRFGGICKANLVIGGNRAFHEHLGAPADAFWARVLAPP